MKVYRYEIIIDRNNKIWFNKCVTRNDIIISLKDVSERTGS